LQALLLLLVTTAALLLQTQAAPYLLLQPQPQELPWGSIATFLAPNR
jgi:hypothetical protein